MKKKLRPKVYLHVCLFFLFLGLISCGGGQDKIGIVKQNWSLACNSDLDCLTGEKCRNTTYPYLGNQCRYIYPFENINYECSHPDDCEFYACRQDTTSSTGFRCKANSDYGADDCGYWGQFYPQYQNEVLNYRCSRTDYVQRRCLYNIECGMGTCGTSFYKQCDPPIFYSNTLNLIYEHVSGVLYDGNAKYRLIFTGSAVSNFSKIRISRATGQSTVIWNLQNHPNGGKYLNIDPHQFNYIEILDNQLNTITFTANTTWVDMGLVLGNLIYNFFTGQYTSNRVYFSWIT